MCLARLHRLHDLRTLSRQIGDDGGRHKQLPHFSRHFRLACQQQPLRIDNRDTGMFRNTDFTRHFSKSFQAQVTVPSCRIGITKDATGFPVTRLIR